jgi:hypothetical protein
MTVRTGEQSGSEEQEHLDTAQQSPGALGIRYSFDVGWLGTHFHETHHQTMVLLF